MLNHRLDLNVRESSFGRLQMLLDEARKAIRLAEYANAEALLNQSLSLSNRDAADYFNLLGACCEGQKQWRQAYKNYTKANSILKSYQPAKMNLRRLIQLRSGGMIDRPVQLGDEPADLWFAQAPAL
jgi:tetratricopeptide (TPR) repeat protein